MGGRFLSLLLTTRNAPPLSVIGIEIARLRFRCYQLAVRLVLMPQVSESTGAQMLKPKSQHPKPYSFMSFTNSVFAFVFEAVTAAFSNCATSLALSFQPMAPATSRASAAVLTPARGTAPLATTQLSAT